VKTREVKTREEANAEKNPNHKTEALATMKRRMSQEKKPNHKHGQKRRNRQRKRQKHRDTHRHGHTQTHIPTAKA